MMRWLDNYPKEVRIFLLASLVNATGSALMWPLTTMYVFDELGRTMANAGFVILIQSTWVVSSDNCLEVRCITGWA